MPVVIHTPLRRLMGRSDRSRVFAGLWEGLDVAPKHRMILTKTIREVSGVVDQQVRGFHVFGHFALAFGPVFARF